MDLEKRVAKELEAQNLPTKVGKSTPAKDKLSYFDIYDLEFVDEDDKTSKVTLTISGNKFAIALQASLLDAVRDLLQFELAKIKKSDSSNSDKIKRSGHPEVRLFFFQKADEATPGYGPLKGEISFDLMRFCDSPLLVDERTNQIQQSDITEISKKIKAIFTDKFSWKRGKKMIVYHDWNRGYQFQIQCATQAEGVRIVKEVLKIQGHTVRPEFLKVNELVNPQAKQVPTGDATILGRPAKHKRYRPEGTVYYSYATLRLPSFGITVPLG